MRQSESEFLEIRGLRYHVRHWRAPGAPKMVLLHGWMDVSASFQFMVDALRAQWDVYAPDWRGYGLTDWGKGGLLLVSGLHRRPRRLLEHIEPAAPVNLVGHSLGGNVAALYAGIRPARVARFVNLEGFGMAPTHAEQAPKRYARWLEELRRAAAPASVRELCRAGGPAAAGQPAAVARAGRSSSRGTGARKRRQGRRAARRSGAQDRQSGALPL